VRAGLAERLHPGQYTWQETEVAVAYSAWWLSAFFAMGCSLHADEFTAPKDGSPQVDTAAADTTVADTEDGAVTDAIQDSSPIDAAVDTVKVDTGPTCPGSSVYCEVAMGCVDLKADNNNCGTCGHVCMAPTPTCKSPGLCKP
jgi:hypothetical protein